MTSLPTDETRRLEPAPPLGRRRRFRIKSEHVNAASAAIVAIPTAIGVLGYVVAHSVGSSHSASGPYAVVVDAATSYSGPSPRLFAVVSSVQSGAKVRLHCSVYGSAPSTGLDLWYATSAGWLDATALDSAASAGPRVNACTGNASSPGVAPTVPSRKAGPFVVITDQGATAQIRSSASITSNVVGTARFGDLVTIDCSDTSSSVVAAPRALGAASSNAQWDHVSSKPSGSLPDSWLNTHSASSPAPRCVS